MRMLPWMMMVALPWSVLAEMRVEVVNAAVRVAGQGKVAVFQPVPREVWVVGQGPLVVPDLPAGWGAETLQVAGGSGVKLVSPRGQAWRVDAVGDSWWVVAGKAQVVPAASAMVLKDGPVGALTVRDGSGQAFKAVPLARGAWGRGAEALRGVVTAGISAVADTALAEVEPAAGKPPVMVASAEADKLVPVRAAPSLRAVSTPVAGQAAQVEDLLPLAGTAAEVSATGVYVAGTVMPFTLPEGYVLEKGRLRREPGHEAVERKLVFARAYGAAEDAALRAGKALAAAEGFGKQPVAPQAVSATETAMATGRDRLAAALAVVAKQEEAEVAALLPATSGVRGYWPGLKQRLAGVNRALDKAGARVADEQPAAHGKEAAAEAPVVDAAAVEPHAGGAAAPAAIDTTGPLKEVWRRSPADVASMPAVQQARRELVAYYLAWGRPHEAAAELAMLPLREDGLPLAKDDRLYLAMSHVLRGRGAESVALLEVDASHRPAHRALWRAAALQQAGRSAEALRAWPENDAELTGYPPAVAAELMLLHGEALLAVGNKADAMAYLDGLTEQVGDGQVARLNYLRGKVRLGTRKEQEGLELLALAAEDPHDLTSAYRAKFDFVRALMRRGELEDHQVTSYLEGMRMLWRGDALEQEILLMLGDYYLKQRNYRGALGRWKTLARVYPDMPGMAALTDKMTEAVLGAFDPENPEQYSPLTYLGLYFDFKELLPNDVRGDRVVEMAGRLLSEQGLPERAIPLLEQVLRYRAVEPIDKARVALVLADAYTANGKPGEALKLLDAHKAMAVNSVQQKLWPLAEARALLALQRPDAVVAALKDSLEKDAVMLRAEAAWQKQSWAYLADVLTPVVARLKPEDLPASMFNQLAVLRLAYAYGQQNERAALEQLLARFGAVGESLPAMADTLAAIATQAGVAEGTRAVRPLALVADSLAGLNSFTDTFRREQRAEAERRDEIEDYNGKMRYMELLPPPAL